MVSFTANTYNSIQYLSFVCTQWSCYNYCYLTLIILLNTIHFHTVEWFWVLLCFTNNSIKHQSFIHSLNVIQFYLIHSRTLSSATTLGQSGHGSNGNERIFHILQSSNTEAIPSNDLMSYSEHSSYSTAEMHSIYSTAPANWAAALNIYIYIYI